MHMKKSRKALSLALCALMIFSAACKKEEASGKAEEPSAEEKLDIERDKYTIRIAAGTDNGEYLDIASGISDAVSEFDYGTEVVETASGVEGLELLLSKDAELAVIEANVAYALGAENKNGVSSLMSLYPGYVQLAATIESGIQSFEDLKGKRVAVGTTGTGTELAASALLKAYGLSYDDISPIYLDYRSALQLFDSKTLDAVFFTSTLPDKLISSHTDFHKLVFIPIDGDGRDKLTDEYGFYEKGVIPAGTYTNTEDIETVTVSNILLVSGELTHNVAYDLTECIYEKNDVIAEFSPASQYIVPENGTKGLSVPLSSGSEAYFSEKGITQ